MKVHPAKRGFSDQYPADSSIIQAGLSVYKRKGIEPILWPRMAGSWFGYAFTGDPLRLPAGHFGLGHGNGAQAPDEYYVIESKNPKIEGIDGAAKSLLPPAHSYPSSAPT